MDTADIIRCNIIKYETKYCFAMDHSLWFYIIVSNLTFRRIPNVQRNYNITQPTQFGVFDLTGWTTTAKKWVALINNRSRIRRTDTLYICIIYYLHLDFQS